MKVLHLSTAMSWRGGEQQLVYLYEGLAKNGFEQLIIAPAGSALADYCTANRLNGKTFLKTKMLPGNLFSILKLIKDFKPEILHAHDSKAHMFLFLLGLFAAISVPLVIHKRVGFSKKRRFFRRFKYKSSGLKKVICVSEYVKERHLEITGDIDLTTVVHSAIDRNRFNRFDKKTIHDQLNIPSDVFIVGNVAALTPEKGLLAFIDAAALVAQRYPEIKFVLVGDGPMRNLISERIKKLGLTENVLLTGFIQDSGALLAGFDVFLFTSVMEGLGTSILDAFACHVPVIATRTGGIPEMVFDGKSGLLTEVNDSRMMADCVLKLYGSEELRNRLVEGSEEVLNLFSVEKMTSEIIQIYHEIKAQ